jgi:hypothetical protein
MDLAPAEVEDGVVGRLRRAAHTLAARTAPSHWRTQPETTVVACSHREVGVRFIQDNSFTVKPDKVEELQRWIVENQARLAATYPKGTSLIGLFVTVFGSNPGVGDFHVLEQLDSYAALDTLAAEDKNPDSEYHRLWMETVEFTDFTRGAPMSRTLLKDLVDATVINAPSQEANEAMPV